MNLLRRRSAIFLSASLLVLGGPSGTAVAQDGTSTPENLSFGYNIGGNSINITPRPSAGSDGTTDTGVTRSGDGGNTGAWTVNAYLDPNSGPLGTAGISLTANAAAGGSGVDGTGADGGDGGSAGKVTINVLGPTTGQMSVSSQGGSAGSGAAAGGVGGQGGDGADVEVNVAAAGKAGAINITTTAGQDAGPVALGRDAGTAGSGGDIVVKVVGQSGAISAVSTGVDAAGVTPGDGGDVTITITGTVNGAVAASSTGSTVGNIKVVVDGGVVKGVISANPEARSTLEIKLDVADRGEFNAAAAAFANASGGSVRINGNDYSWSGFDSLSNLLRYVGPNDTVVVTIGSPSSTGDAFSAPTAGPLLATGPVRCLPRTFTAQRQGDGSVRLISKMVEGDGFFEFGFVRGAAFDASPGTPDWAVNVVTDKRNQHAEITDADGQLLGICVLAGRSPKAFAALR